MKKISLAVLILTLALMLASCSGDARVILDNSEKSRFTDFYTEGDYAYIECVLNIYAEKDCEVRISAFDSEDVEAGLLKNPELVGIDKSNGDDKINLKKGENEIEILFRGEYDGVYQITRRDIPRFIEITAA